MNSVADLFSDGGLNVEHDITNYMRLIVEQTLYEILENRQDYCDCERCRLDALALALNHLPPKYVVTHKGYVYTKLEELAFQFRTDVTVAVTNSLKTVSSNPRH